jgi:cell division septation protein DedD
MSQQEDTEITLGTGRLLGIFFGLVVVCAIFFGMGFSAGRNSALRQEPSTTLEAPPSVATSGLPKPAATKDDTPSTSDELTFYKSVEQKDAAPELQKPAEETPAPTVPIEPVRASANGTYLVQVAAVSKSEDAEALAGALRQKQYPAFVFNNPAARLYHVQVGPFEALSDAESMRTRLIKDGYSPIVKK